MVVGSVPIFDGPVPRYVARIGVPNRSCGALRFQPEQRRQDPFEVARPPGQLPGEPVLPGSLRYPHVIAVDGSTIGQGARTRPHLTLPNGVTGTGHIASDLREDPGETEHVGVNLELDGRRLHPLAHAARALAEASASPRRHPPAPR
jgi:hypothetical protein